MKKLLLILAIFTPLLAFAITGDKTRFDWSLGQPAITADNTNTCTDTAIARFDWVLGQPAIVHDATANCTLAVAGTAPSNKSVNIQGQTMTNGQVIINP